MFPAGQRIDMRDPHERTVVLVGITLPQELQIARQSRIAQRSSRPVHSGARLRFRSWGNGLAYLLFGLGPGQKISDDTKGESARALSPLLNFMLTLGLALILVIWLLTFLRTGRGS
jgi:hypothetical protein